MLQPILIAVSCAIAAGLTAAVALVLFQRRLLRAALHTALGEVTEGLRAAAASRGEHLDEVSPSIPVGTPSTRVALPMSSGVNVPIGHSVQITSRPHNASFRPERIVIGCPEEWAVDVVTIDDRSQLKDGPVRADALGPGISWDVVGRGNQLAMTVTYLGDREEGAPFQCSILGIPLDLGGPVDPRLLAPGIGAEAVAR